MNVILYIMMYYTEVSFMGVEKPVYSFRLNKELVDTLKVLATQQNRTLSNLVETILLQYVSDHTDND